MQRGIRTSSRPASLAVPHLGHILVTANALLDVGGSLEHVVKVDVGGILPGSALPESKRVDEDDISSAKDGIRGSISELVPAVGSADLDSREGLLDSLDLALQLLAGEVAAVQGLGTNGDGVDGVLEFASYLLDGVQIIVE